jgi:glycosyltransferase involved in cell wall biosynthesis
MELVLFCHPSFMSSQSMPRFAEMLKGAYEARGHRVQVWSPRAIFFSKVPRGRLSKWAGYVDQYLLFPMWVRKALKRTSLDTLFVFVDQALGPWVPLVENRPHVVHAHDLLALRSALGDIPENPTSATGRIYQRYIRRGFRRARHFISISGKTRNDLHHFGRVTPLTSEIVYNGLNFPYAPLAFEDSERILHGAGLSAPAVGLLLHVGGGQWYKNLAGVIAIYAQYAGHLTDPLPLWCVSPPPKSGAAKSMLDKVPEKGRVRFLGNLDSATLQALYSRASAFLFPSLAEGFGWPLIEAQACGCPVITTDEPPMNEVAGEAACYLPRLKSPAQIESWSARGAIALRELLSESAPAKARRKELGQAWVKRFDANGAIDGYLSIYKAVSEITLTRRSVEPGLDQSTQV